MEREIGIKNAIVTIYMYIQCTSRWIPTSDKSLHFGGELMTELPNTDVPHSECSFMRCLQTSVSNIGTTLQASSFL